MAKRQARKGRPAARPRARPAARPRAAARPPASKRREDGFSGARLARFFVNSVDLLCIAGFDGYFKRLSRSWEGALGYTRKELKARPYAEFIHPEDRERTAAEAAKLGRGARVLRFENRYMHKDGGVRWLQWSAMPDPASGLIYAAARDVTEERGLQEALHASQTRLRTIVDSVGEGIVVYDAEGWVESANDAAQELLGIEPGTDPGEFLMSEGRGIVDADGRPIPLAERASYRALQSGRTVEGALMGVDLPGRKRRWLKVNARPLVLPGESAPSGVVCSYADITDLRRAEAQFRLLLEAAPCGFFLLDKRARIRLVNGFAERMFGFDREELLGKPLHFLAPEGYREKYIRNWGAFVANPRTWDMSDRREIWGRRRDGSSFPMDVGMNPVELDGALHVLASMSDVSDRLKLKQQAELARDAAVELARLKSDFLANMSHEIRTPLNAVIGMSDMLQETRLDARQADFVRTLQAAGDSLLSVVGDILDFSKIESGKLTLEEADFDPAATAEEAVGILSPGMAEKGLEALALIQPGLPSLVRGDRGRLRQVLLNLLGNARKFASEGSVFLQVTRDPGDALSLRFSVTDGGIGIPEAVQAKLFEPFVQADASTTRRFGGTGLGLAISKRLVELMGGRIGLVSREGLGSSFFFSVPFLPASGEAPQKRVPRRALRGLRAAIVDDNPAGRKVLRSRLELVGVHCEDFGSGPEVLHALRLATQEGRPFTFLLTDLHMPQMDGLELAKAARAEPELHGLKVVLLSSSGPEPDRAELAGAVDSVLAKPIRQEALLDGLTVALSGEPGPAPGPRAAPSPPARGGKALLVEDNAVNRKVALQLLESLGWTADSAANGAEAVEAAARVRYDLVLMDCQMPGMDGYEASRRIREREGGKGRVPIVALTANAMEGDRQRCLAAGMDDYLAKPIRRETLAAALARWHGLLDPELLQQLRELDDGKGAFLPGLLTTFREQSERTLGELNAAAQAGDSVRLAKAAHALRGSAASMGARRVQELAGRLEGAAKAGSAAGAPEAVAELRAAVLEAERALERELGA